MEYTPIFENLKDFMGSGFSFVLLLAGVLFLGLSMKKSASKEMMVWYPVYVLALYFCPLWLIYTKFRDDYEILYRILWLIPIGLIVAYSLVELIYRIDGKKRPIFFGLAIILIMLSGKYVYSNPQYSKAENVYHIPQTIVDICDEIVIDGGGVGACFPLEMIQYVRQYTPYIYQPYGRDLLTIGEYYNDYSSIVPMLRKDVLNAEEICGELRFTHIHYLIISDDTVFDEDPANYDYVLQKNIDGYDIYKDITARFGW